VFEILQIVGCGFRINRDIRNYWLWLFPQLFIALVPVGNAENNFDLCISNIKGWQGQSQIKFSIKKSALLSFAQSSCGCSIEIPII